MTVIVLPAPAPLALTAGYTDDGRDRDAELFTTSGGPAAAFAAVSSDPAAPRFLSPTFDSALRDALLGLIFPDRLLTTNGNVANFTKERIRPLEDRTVLLITNGKLANFTKERTRPIHRELSKKWQKLY